MYIDSEKPLLGMIHYIINQSIICGTNNPRIKEKLLQDETIDLSRAINIARGIEISTHQLKDLSEEATRQCTQLIKVGVNQVKTKYKTIKDSEVGKNGNLEDV